MEGRSAHPFDQYGSLDGYKARSVRRKVKRQTMPALLLSPYSQRRQLRRSACWGDPLIYNIWIITQDIPSGDRQEKVDLVDCVERFVHVWINVPLEQTTSSQCIFSSQQLWYSRDSLHLLEE